jgi:Mn-dependent DtxR family transcriptional regulator
MQATNDDIRAMFSRLRKAQGWTQPGVFPHDMEGWRANGYTQGLYDAMCAMTRLGLLDEPGFVDVESDEGVPEKRANIEELTRLVNEARMKEKELNEQLGYEQDHAKGALSVSMRWDTLDALLAEFNALRTAAQPVQPADDTDTRSQPKNATNASDAVLHAAERVVRRWRAKKPVRYRPNGENVVYETNAITALRMVLRLDPEDVAIED